MQSNTKKQFSLSLLMRIFLGLLVVISIGVCARSIMQYNELNREAEQLEAALEDLYEIRAELIEDLGSAEELKRILADYQNCRLVTWLFLPMYMVLPIAMKWFFWKRFPQLLPRR